MSEQLSSAAIEALFDAAREGNLTQDAGHPVRRRRVRKVDFSRPAKFSIEQERRLRRSHEGFCQTAGTRLSGEARGTVDVEVIGVEQLNWTDGVLQLGQGAVAALVDVTPLGTRLLLSADRQMVLTFIERMCGGTLDGTPEDRRLTEIDVALSQRLLEHLVDLLSPVWNELMGVGLQFAALELDPQASAIARPSEPTLMLAIEVALGKATFGLRLLVPYVSIAEVASQFASSEVEEIEGTGDADCIKHALNDVEIQLRAELTATEMTAVQLLKLQVGDVLHFTDGSGVTLFAGAVPVHRGVAGAHGHDRAVQVRL